MAPEKPADSSRSLEPESMANTVVSEFKEPEHGASSSPSGATIDEVLKSLDMAVAEAMDVPATDDAVCRTEPLLVSQDTGGNGGQESDPDGEISIEQYMKSLLERTRGYSSDCGPETPSGVAPKSDESVSGQLGAQGESERADGMKTPASGSQAVDQVTETPAPKRPPEQRETLSSFRDVANRSAHRALASSSGKQLAAKSRDTLLTAMVLQVVSFALVAITPPALSLGYFAAVVAFIVSTAWTLRFAGLTRQLTQVVAWMQTESRVTAADATDEACSS